MSEASKNPNYLKVADSVISDQKSSFREKPYARLKDQIYYWENEEYAIPIRILESVSSSKKELFSKIEESKPKFKIGKRGNGNGLVRLPVKLSDDIYNIASKCVSSSRELRIRKCSDSVSSKLEEIFDVSVRKTENKHSVKNWAVADFFNQFYIYKPKFRSYDEDEIVRLRRFLEL